MRQIFVQTKTFTNILFAVAVVFGVVGILGGFEQTLMLCLVIGLGALLKLLVVDL
jgi:hypothetical protein